MLNLFRNTGTCGEVAREGYRPPWPGLAASYFTSLGMLAKAPVLDGAPGFMDWFEGPPEVLPGGEMVLESTGTSMVTEQELRQLSGLFTIQSKVLA